MGNCMWRVSPTEANEMIYAAKNIPLKREVVRWRSEVALTIGQLLGKRDEFWETAPAFEGRQEIWDAIKVAANAVEAEDYNMAQAIIDGAGIYTPSGSLMEAYDELGNHYQVPIYCLSKPINLHYEEIPIKVQNTTTPAIVNPDDLTIYSENAEDAEVHYIKVRISTSGEERIVPMLGYETIGMGKKKLSANHCGRQRWFYCGKLLEEHAKIKGLNIPKDYIIQVIITPIDSNNVNEDTQ